VATIYSIGVYKLPRALRIFMKAHPSVRVELNYRAWNELLEEVKSNAVDIGLVAHPQRGEFEVVPIEEETLVLGVYPGHTFAKLTSVKAKDLHRQRFIMFPSRSPTGKGIERQLRHAGVKVQPVMEIQNVDTIKRAVEIGAGIAILPKNVMGAEVESGTLMQVEISDVEMKRPIGVIYKKGKRLSPPIRKFIEVLKGTKGGEK